MVQSFSGALGPGRLCFGCTVQCMGICCRLDPGLYLRPWFTCEVLTLKVARLCPYWGRVGPLEPEPFPGALDSGLGLSAGQEEKGAREDEMVGWHH